MKPASPPSILFIRLRLLGDIIMSIPALLSYRQHQPDVPVYYALEDAFASMADLLPGISGVYIIPRQMSFKDHIHWRRQCRDWNVQTVIDLHSGPKSALLTRISGSPIRIGYRTRNRNWAYNRLSDNRSPDRPILHSVVSQLSLLEKIGIKTDQIPAYQTSIPVADIQLPPGFTMEPQTHIPTVTIHVGAGNPFRYWGDQHYLDLLERLVKSGISCQLIGHTPQEAQRAREWSLLHPGFVHNRVGSLSITETLALIHHSQCYFGPDSGPLHLATLTDTPIVCLYGPNIPAISGPWRKGNVTILESDLSCRPCSQRECRYDTIRCMEVIDAERVFQSILRYLG